MEPDHTAGRALAQRAAQARLWRRIRWLNLAGHAGSAPAVVAILWGLADHDGLLRFLAISWGFVGILALTYVAHGWRNDDAPLPLSVYAALSVSNAFLGGGLFLLTPVADGPSLILALGLVLYAGVAGMLVTSAAQAPLMRVALVSVLGSYALGCVAWGQGAIAAATLFFLAVVAKYAVPLLTNTQQQLVDARFEAELAARRAAQALEAKRSAQDASDAKSRFLANMSHELRTPLNVILGYAALVDEDLADHDLEAVSQDIVRIRSAGEQLSSLIGNILDLTKIEARQLHLEVASVALAPELNRVVDLMRPLIEQRGNRLELRLPDDRPLDATCDLARTRQIVLNLVANANKFTEAGDITLVGIHRDASVRIEVHDSGVGIPEAHLERIFDRFSQVDETSTRSRDGAGLGLAISRALAETMGGQLSVTSTEGAGSVFVLELPCAAA